MGTLTSWNSLGHSRPVTGILYLYFYPKNIFNGLNICLDLPPLKEV